MIIRNNTIILKRSNVAGKKPNPGQLMMGELGLNTADGILYASGTTQNKILAIGWDRIFRTGDTMTGQLNLPTISATTYLNLPKDIFVTGATVNSGTTIFKNNSGGTFSVSGFSTGNTTSSGTTNYVSKFINPNTLGNSNIFDNGVNVGIGTTAPSAQLEVYGRISQRGLGTNTFVGYRVGVNDITTDGRNTAFGYNSFVNNITGNNNVSFGFISLEKNTTGASNVAIGAYSLRLNETGSSNVSIGLGSMERNISGGVNVSIGSYTMRNNISGYSNVGIGPSVLSNNISGSNNLGMMNQALKNSDGNENIGLGIYSLSNNLTGNSNIAIGSRSLFNVNSNLNIGIGESAGRWLGNSMENTGSTNSIFIGQNTRTLSDNQTNEIVIGQNAFGNGTNSVTLGSDAITKTLLKGSVGIGTTAPTAPLEVYGRVSQQGLGTSTYFGYQAGRIDDLNGRRNTGIGYNSSMNNLTGSTNTGVGYGSLFYNSGAGNTGLGDAALYWKGVGDNNVAIGVSAGSFVLNGTKNFVSHRSIFIGRQATALNDGETNQIVIGDAAVGNGSNSVTLGSDAIRKTYLKGDISIKKVEFSNREKLITTVGSNIIVDISMVGFDSAFFDYVIKKDGNVRAGTIYSCHNGLGVVEFTEVSTNDIGDTSDVNLSVILTNNYFRLVSNSTTDGWLIKTLVKTI